MLLLTVSEKVNNGIETSKIFFKNVENKAINLSDNITNSTVDTLNNAQTTTQNIIQDGVSKANNMTTIAYNNLQSALESLWNNWVTNHPTIAFFVSHPFISIVLIIIFILTIWGIIQMIPSLFVNFWLMLFKSPFILGKSLLNTNSQEVISENFSPKQEKLLKQILEKLESIETKQSQLELRLDRLNKN
ncbi:hypothetical protein [Geminocystis herdmanii]|uniref:hypothetical protein n=1 Tax=Geminocystis herdmanii TaxID=669359 RepID=UPI0003703B55|nr:hypothetical protein [Geminocystis herdmanii]